MAGASERPRGWRVVARNWRKMVSGRIGVVAAEERLCTPFGDVVGKGMVPEQGDPVIVRGVLAPGENDGWRQRRVVCFSKPNFARGLAGGEGQREGQRGAIAGYEGWFQGRKIRKLGWDC
jgi:hypothetical protein